MALSPWDVVARIALMFLTRHLCVFLWILSRPSFLMFFPAHVNSITLYAANPSDKFVHIPSTLEVEPTASASEKLPASASRVPSASTPSVGATHSPLSRHSRVVRSGAHYLGLAATAFALSGFAAGRVASSQALPDLTPFQFNTPSLEDDVERLELFCDAAFSTC